MLFTKICLLPLPRPQYQERSQSGSQHDSPCHEVTVLPVQLGHEFEVHSPYAYQEGKGDEDGRYDGKPFHDVVHAHVAVRYIQVHER